MKMYVFNRGDLIASFKTKISCLYRRMTVIKSL